LTGANDMFPSLDVSADHDEIMQTDQVQVAQPVVLEESSIADAALGNSDDHDDDQSIETEQVASSILYQFQCK